MEVNDKKYHDYLNMANFMNMVLPLLVNLEQYELCRKYIQEGRLSQEDLDALVKAK